LIGTAWHTQTRETTLSDHFFWLTSRRGPDGWVLLPALGVWISEYQMGVE
jgi:hypothetical protein